MCSCVYRVHKRDTQSFNQCFWGPHLQREPTQTEITRCGTPVSVPRRAPSFLDDGGSAWTQSDASDQDTPSGGRRHRAASGEAIPLSDLSGGASRGGPATYERRHRKKETGFSTPSQADIDNLYVQFMFCSKDVVRNALNRNHNNKEEAFKELVAKGYRPMESALTPSPQQLNSAPTPLDKLKAQFPSVPKDVVQDMFAACENNEASTIELLEELGFKRAGADSSSSTPSRSAASPSRSAASPQHQPSTSGASASASPKRSLTSVEKERVKKKFLTEFHSLDQGLVQMAVETCDYEEETIRHVLQVELGNKKSSNTRSKKSPARNAAAASLSSSPASPPPAASCEPVVLASSSSTPTPPATKQSKPSGQTPKGKKPSKGKAPSSRTTTPSPTTTPSRHPAPSRPSAPAPRPPTQQNQRQQQQRAKQVTRMSEQLLDKTTGLLDHLTGACCTQPAVDQAAADDEDEARATATAGSLPSPVVTNQPWKSEFLTKPSGPDPSLRQGPDQSLLLSSYISTLGPNPQYQCGPDSSRVHGPQGSVGPDPALHCGPQSRRGASYLSLSSPHLLISDI